MISCMRSLSRRLPQRSGLTKIDPTPKVIKVKSVAGFTLLFFESNDLERAGLVTVPRSACSDTVAGGLPVT